MGVAVNVAVGGIGVLVGGMGVGVAVNVAVEGIGVDVGVWVGSGVWVEVGVKVSVGGMGVGVDVNVAVGVADGGT